MFVKVGFCIDGLFFVVWLENYIISLLADYKEHYGYKYFETR